MPKHCLEGRTLLTNVVLKVLLGLKVKERTARNRAVTGSTMEMPDQPG